MRSILSDDRDLQLADRVLAIYILLTQLRMLFMDLHVVRFFSNAAFG